MFLNDISSKSNPLVRVASYITELHVYVDVAGKKRQLDCMSRARTLEGTPGQGSQEWSDW